MLLPFADLDDGSDKFYQEAGNLQQTWEEMVEEVDDETFDVRSIMILEGKDST